MPDDAFPYPPDPPNVPPDLTKPTTFYRLRGIQGEWISRFMEQLGEVIEKAQRIHFKSLGGILALQEKLAEQWAAQSRSPVEPAGVGAESSA